MNYCKFCLDPLRDGEPSCSRCSSESHKTIPAHRLLPGTLLNGRYRIGKVLGEGGFGITYIGRDMKLDMKVAVKEYYPNGLVNRNNTFSPTVNCSVTGDKVDFFINGRKKFIQEARILAKFANERGIVEVRDFFESNNTAYIIMEYLEGQDLKEYLKVNGPLPVEKAVQTLIPVIKTLAKIHQHGLIHRDISPDNIRLTPDGVKLIDFGAAREMTTNVNQSISVMLKPGYAPEEQYRSKGIQGPWTDVYAVCATLYKCITGITPDDAVQRSYSDELKKPSQLGIRISPAVESVILKGMSVRQQNRYQTMDELQNTLIAAVNIGGAKTDPRPLHTDPKQDIDKTVHIGIQPDIKKPHTEQPVKSVPGSAPHTGPSYSPPITIPPAIKTLPHPPSASVKHSKDDAKVKKIIAGVIISVIAVIIFIMIITIVVGISISNSSSGNSDYGYDDSYYDSYDTAQDSEATQNDIAEQTYPLSDAKETAQDYTLALINDAAESISYEIIDWSTFEKGFDNAAMYVTNASTVESAYAAYTDSLKINVTCAEDLLDYLSSSNVDRINALLGDNANAEYSSCTGNYLTEEEAQPYLDSLYSTLDSLSKYEISSDSVSLDNVLQYAKVNFTETVSGDLNSAAIEFSVVLGYVDGEWKIIYIESTDTVSVLNSLTIISDLVSPN